MRLQGFSKTFLDRVANVLRKTFDKHWKHTTLRSLILSSGDKLPTSRINQSTCTFVACATSTSQNHLPNLAWGHWWCTRWVVFFRSGYYSEGNFCQSSGQYFSHFHVSQQDQILQVGLHILEAGNNQQTSPLIHLFHKRSQNSMKMTKVQKRSSIILQHRPLRFSPVRDVPKWWRLAGWLLHNM